MKDVSHTPASSSNNKFKNKHTEELFREYSIRNAALLVLDMQEYFVLDDSHAYIPGIEKIIQGISNLVTVFSEASRPIVFTYHKGVSNKLFTKWWRDPMKRDLSICEQLDYEEHSILEKNTYDAFYNTELTLLLEESKFIVICGVVTDICVETTARSAFCRDILPIIPFDTTASYSEERYNNSLSAAARSFAIITSSEEIIKCR